MATGEKAPGAFKTIGELSQELGVAQHILRYWETRFPQLRPLQRAGNRRYYRPADVELACKINRLLNYEGYTVRGVQKLLNQRAPGDTDRGDAGPSEAPLQPAEPPLTGSRAAVEVHRLRQIRDRLASAIGED